MIVCAAGIIWAAAPVHADSSSGGIMDDDWFARSDAAKESQPHWMTPVITVTPRLEQEYRYDQSFQARPNDVDLTNYGGGKGLELIPTSSTELIIGVPAWQVRTAPGKPTERGALDETFLLKLRLVSRNEESGNFIVTAFLGLSIPTGSAAFSNNHAIYTPTLAAGKGWGDRHQGFDIQTTVSIAIPDSGMKKLGEPITWNTAFQGHLFEKFWPEIEVNYSHFKDGPNDGKDQWALAGGIVFGRFELGHRARLIVGTAYQETVSSFKSFRHTFLLTGRVAF
ncbi:MAG TPA: hypothetical protein VLW26_02405 [Steroidobacteraceae bacterium]|nr:hypothetical protein [Steroidobacteraceae bacterium]